MRPRAQLARIVVVVATPTRLNAFMLAVLPLSVLGMQCGALLAVPLQAPRRRPLKKAFVDLGRCTLKFASQVVQTITLLWESKAMTLSWVGCLQVASFPGVRALQVVNAPAELALVRIPIPARELKAATLFARSPGQGPGAVEHTKENRLQETQGLL
jgi:hypothetical protein